jgi:hypothetical protein
MIAEPVKEDFVRECLDESQLSDVRYKVYEEPARARTVIRLRKEASDETLQFNITLSNRQVAEFDDTKQLIAMEIGNAINYFKEEIEDVIEWQDKRVLFDLHDSYEATCHTCGNSVTLDEMSQPLPLNSESSVPRGTVQDGYEQLPKVKQKFALLAMLRRSCEPPCPNAEAERFKYL